jgi:hypothetical protein
VKAIAGLLECGIGKLGGVKIGGQAERATKVALFLNDHERERVGMAAHTADIHRGFVGFREFWHLLPAYQISPRDSRAKRQA